ncbi:hypothetical protein [Psychrobacter sp. H7-1]|uniref:hypothetical protein n=1 Tax=Psychrobacter sp. H7-1 TaxID=1569265 RepID=UPI001918FE09|nr:hypothetical protein [Psychrobacter sp. H7-1]
MSITYHDCYQQKQEIEKNSFSPKEAYIRVLISRGYYAAYSHSQELFKPNAPYKISIVRANPITDKPYGSHEKFYESLMADKDVNLNNIGKLLQKYHRLRKKSDYKLNQHINDLDKKNAEKYLDECKKRIDFFLVNGPIPYP